MTASVTKILKLDAIRIDGETQVREQIDESTVKDYAEAYEAGAKLPAVVVFHDGSDYWLAEGFHRYHAARRGGQSMVHAEIHNGTARDAQWYAAGANTTHGLRRTNKDKQNAVALALKLHPEFSDENIATHCGVSRRMVLDDRDQHVKVSQVARVGVDGKTRTLPPPPTQKRTLPPPPMPPPKGQPTPAAPIPEPPPAGPVDSFGRVIPKELRAMWERRGEVAHLRSLVSEVRVAVKQAMEDGDKLYSTLHYQNTLQWLDNVYRELGATQPYIVCPWCGGLSATCKRCGGPSRGFVSEFAWRTFATPEMRKQLGQE